MNDVAHLNMYLGACKSFQSHAITLIAETPIEVKPFKRDTGTISSSVCTSLKAFCRKMRNKSPKILLKTIRGRSNHNLIKIREKRTKKILSGIYAW